MAHEIKKYETDDGECLTKCNHRPFASIDGTRRHNFVGSAWCRRRCPNHVSDNGSEVECSFIGDEADRAVKHAKENYA